jgi:hypothetical protein
VRRKARKVVSGRAGEGTGGGSGASQTWHRSTSGLDETGAAEVVQCPACVELAAHPSG